MENGKIINEITRNSIDWSTCIVDENGHLINKVTGEDYGKYLYFEEELEQPVYRSVSDVIRATLRIF